VARVAGDEAGFGQARVEIELLAQFHLRQVDLLDRANRLDRLVGGKGAAENSRDRNGQQRTHEGCFGFHDVLLIVVCVMVRETRQPGGNTRVCAAAGRRITGRKFNT
jgi:hypothetical protein